MADQRFTVTHSELLDEMCYYTKHPSGAEIYVLPKKMSSAYAVFATRYGSIDSVFALEGEEPVTVPDGIAHFLEHKMFENEDGEDTFAKFARTGGNANAYTSFDRTCYLFSATEKLSENLRTLFTFVTHPYFTEENVKKEQGIIAEELRMYLDQPGQKLYYQMLEGMYHNHPVKKNIGGTIESISHITPEILYRCYRTFYDPSNMIFAVSGDLDPDMVLSVADEILPKESYAKKIVRCYPEEPENVVCEEAVSYAKVARPMLQIGIKDTFLPDTPSRRSKKGAAMDVLNETLFGKCSDFYNELYDEGIINGSFDCTYESGSGFAFDTVYADTDAPQEVVSRLKAYLDTLRGTHHIPVADFERAKRVVYAGQVAALDSTEDVASTCLDFALDDDSMFRAAKDVTELTMEDMYALLDTLFVPSHMTVSIVKPLEEEK